MQHIVLKATATVGTDQELGEFEALVSTGTPDRSGDVVMRGAFTATIQAWRQASKMLPLSWNHGTDPEDLIGVIDPMEMEQTDQGLVVAGKVDIEGSAKGQEAWRVVKSGSLGLSFGYAITDSRPHEGKGLDLLSIDLYEVSLTPTPMNSDTKVLSWKAAEQDESTNPLAGIMEGTRRRLRLEDLEDPEPSKEEKAAAEAKRLATPITIKSFEV